MNTIEQPPEEQVKKDIAKEEKQLSLTDLGKACVSLYKNNIQTNENYGLVSQFLYKCSQFKQWKNSTHNLLQNYMPAYAANLKCEQYTSGKQIHFQQPQRQYYILTGNVILLTPKKEQPTISRQSSQQFYVNVMPISPYQLAGIVERVSKRVKQCKNVNQILDDSLQQDLARDNISFQILKPFNSFGDITTNKSFAIASNDTYTLYSSISHYNKVFENVLNRQQYLLDQFTRLLPLVDEQDIQQQLIPLFTEYSYQKQQFVYQYNQPSNYVYLLRTGLCQVQIPTRQEQQQKQEAKENTMNSQQQGQLIKPGEMFGHEEVAAGSQPSRMFQCQSLANNTTVYRAERDAIFSLQNQKIRSLILANAFLKYNTLTINQTKQLSQIKVRLSFSQQDFNKKQGGRSQSCCNGSSSQSVVLVVSKQQSSQQSIEQSQQQNNKSSTENLGCIKNDKIQELSQLIQLKQSHNSTGNQAIQQIQSKKGRYDYNNSGDIKNYNTHLIPTSNGNNSNRNIISPCSDHNNSNSNSNGKQLQYNNKSRNSLQQLFKFIPNSFGSQSPKQIPYFRDQKQNQQLNNNNAGNNTSSNSINNNDSLQKFQIEQQSAKFQQKRSTDLQENIDYLRKLRVSSTEQIKMNSLPVISFQSRNRLSSTTLQQFHSPQQASTTNNLPNTIEASSEKRQSLIHENSSSTNFNSPMHLNLSMLNSIYENPQQNISNSKPKLSISLRRSQTPIKNLNYSISNNVREKEKQIQTADSSHHRSDRIKMMQQRISFSFASSLEKHVRFQHPQSQSSQQQINESNFGMYDGLPSILLSKGMSNKSNQNNLNNKSVNSSPISNDQMNLKSILRNKEEVSFTNANNNIININNNNMKSSTTNSRIFKQLDGITQQRMAFKKKSQAQKQLIYSQINALQ